MRRWKPTGGKTLDHTATDSKPNRLSVVIHNNYNSYYYNRLMNRYYIKLLTSYLWHTLASCPYFTFISIIIQSATVRPHLLHRYNNI